MMSRIRRFLAPPVFDDEEKTRAARLLNLMLLVFLGAAVLVLVAILAISGWPTEPAEAFTLLAAVVLGIMSLALLFMVRRGRLRPAGWIALALMFAAMGVWIAGMVGISDDSSPMMLLLVILVAGLLLGGRAAMIFTWASMAVVIIAYLAEINGWWPLGSEGDLSAFDLVFTLAPLLIGGLLLRYAVNSLTEALDRAQRNEQAQIVANRELSEIRASLEGRVAERTRDLARRSSQLQATVEVGRTATSSLDPAQLMWRIAESIQERFGLYHAGLFQIDPTGLWAEYLAGAGQGGHELAEQRFHLEVGGPTMVGWCTAHAQTRVTQDTQATSGQVERADHPLVPATRSEAALPLIAHGQVIGALSVQSDQPGTFDPDMVVILETMVDQVAIALDNARLFAESQQALEVARRAYGERSRQAWTEGAELGYRYSRGAVVPVEGDWQPEMAEVIRTGQATLTPLGSRRQGSGAAGEREPLLAIPLKVRDRTVGALGFYKGQSGAGDTWTTEEAALLGAIVDQLGVALESAQLFEGTQRRAARERLIGEVTARVRESLDVDAVLKTAIREMGDALDLAEVEVRMGSSRDSRSPSGGEGVGR